MVDQLLLIALESQHQESTQETKQHLFSISSCWCLFCFVFFFFFNPDASLKQCKLYQMSSSPFACAIQPFQETSQLKPCTPTASFPKADVHKSGDEVHSNEHRFLSCISKTQTCKHKSNKAKFLFPSRERTVPRPALLRADKTLLLATRKKMGIDKKAKSSSVQTFITFYGIPRQYLLFILCLFPVIHHDASPSIRNTQVVDKK